MCWKHESSLCGEIFLDVYISKGSPYSLYFGNYVFSYSVNLFYFQISFITVGSRSNDEGWIIAGNKFEKLRYYTHTQLTTTTRNKGSFLKNKLFIKQSLTVLIFWGEITCWSLTRVCSLYIENNTVNGQNRDLTVGRPSSYRVPGHCLRIAKLCENIGYNFTQMPNYFKQRNQNDAEHELSQFTRMIQSKCSSVLHVFLCSLYFPPCADDAGRTTPPCRSVCRTARRDCEPWIKRSGFKWPYKFECSSFPDPSESACVGEDGSITQGESASGIFI